MRRRLVTASAAAFTVALSPVLAAAQSTGAASAGANRTTAPTATTASRSPALQATWQKSQRASKIIGMDVVNRNGEKVGDVEDIVLDRNGNVAYAVVSTGGFLGVGERLHAVPWRSLKTDTGADNFLLDVDREKLRVAPGFDASSFPDVNDPKWSTENRKHFPAPSTPASSASGRSSGRAGMTGGASDIGRTTATSGRSGTAAGTGTTSPDPKQPTPGSSNTTGNPTSNQSGTAGALGKPPTTDSVTDSATK